jgi:hypothetical protein
MFLRFGPKLSLVFCLAFQVMVSTCASCQCRQAEQGTLVMFASGKDPDAGKKVCWACRARPEARPTYRQLVAKNEVQLPATASDRARLRNDSTLVHTSGFLARDAVSSASASEMQVYLE